MPSITAGVTTLPKSTIDISASSPEEIETGCQEALFEYTTPGGRTLRLKPGTFSHFVENKWEILKKSDGTPATAEVSEDGGVTWLKHRAYSGIMYACANRAIRAVVLAPVAPMTNPGLRAFEYSQNTTKNTTGFRWLCLKFKASDTGLIDWYCGKGLLADGVTGYAYKKSSVPTYRSFYVKKLTIPLASGGNLVLDRHFELSTGLGAIAMRISAAEATGYGLDYQWNFNPLDFYPDGTSKAKFFLASISAKTATNRSGVYISPYNNANVTGSAGFNLGKLNQGESGYWRADVASDGTVGDGILLDVSVGPYYSQWRQNGCFFSAPTDWGGGGVAAIKGVPVKEYFFPDGSFRYDLFNVGASGEPIVGTTLGLGEEPRCPEWQDCEDGTPPNDITVNVAGPAGTMINVVYEGNEGFCMAGGSCTFSVTCGRSIQLFAHDGPPWPASATTLTASRDAVWTTPTLPFPCDITSHHCEALATSAHVIDAVIQ